MLAGSYTKSVSAAIPSVFLQVEENPNCSALDGQVFQPRTVPRAITRLRCSYQGVVDCFEVTGLTVDGEPCAASACLIDDSGEGACHLIFGGDWGLRFRKPSNGVTWDLNNTEQWGESYLLLPATETDLIFCPSTQS